MQLIKKIAPDLTEEMIKRYRVLKTVRLLQPCGRRLVVLSLGMTERTVRSEIERLSAQALVHISKIGMSLTEEGMEVLEGLETIFSALTGLSILEERLTDALGAQKVFIAQGDSDSSERAQKEMGQLAARVLSENTTEDLRIAIAGGSAMASWCRRHRNPLCRWRRWYCRRVGASDADWSCRRIPLRQDWRKSCRRIIVCCTCRII